MPQAAPIPRLVQPLVPLISWTTARYIAYHRRRLAPQATSIPGELLTSLHQYFPPTVLAKTRIVRSTMPEPLLYPLVGLLGIKGLLEVSSIGAITLVDVVAYPDELDCETLFHELVHVVQYRILGLKRFARFYVKGFLKGGGYKGIPLEQQAYELGARFERDSEKVFSVEEDVIRRLENGLL
jgi:hypothetical protein